jgi:hypothetical protein
VTIIASTQLSASMRKSRFIDSVGSHSYETRQVSPAKICGAREAVHTAAAAETAAPM